MNMTPPPAGGSGTKGGRRLVHLRLAGINAVSALKVSFLLAVALAVVEVVFAFVLWLLVAQLGMFQPINDLLSTTTSDGSDNVSRIFSFGRVLGLSVLAGVVTIIFGTLGGGLIAVIYNAIARIVGGVKLTFSNVK